MPERTPEERAGPLSRTLFLWAQPLLRRGFCKPLAEGDALPLPTCLRPAALGQRFAAAWDAELLKSTSSKGLSKEPSLYRALWATVGGQLAMALVTQVFVILLKLGCVIVVRQLAQLVAANNTTKGSLNEGLVVAAVLCILNALDGVLSAIAAYYMKRAVMGLSCCFAVSTLRKGMRLHPSTVEANQRGDLVTLALSDCTQIEEVSDIFLQGLSAPFFLVASLIFLVSILGPLVLVVVLPVMLATFSINRVSTALGINFGGKMNAQGSRLSVLNEMLQSARFTKYYSLEDQYQAKMSEHRRLEISFLFRMKVMDALNWPVALIVPLAITSLVLPLYLVVYGEMPPPGDTMAVVAAARFSYLPFAFFGLFLSTVNMLMTSCGRLSMLLRQHEIERRPRSDLIDGAPAVSLRDVSCSWAIPALADSTSVVLQKISLEVPPGQLWSIVGSIGSGKSSLLLSVLGSLSCTATNEGSRIEVRGSSRVYVGQEPMIINATLRDNVLFGVEDVDEARYSAALQVACLGPDLEILPAGDATEIGERGVTLSGGQKARVALARAVLASKPGGLVLLDDPFAAVYEHVGADLFEHCLCGSLAGTTRLVVTNQLQLLSHDAVNRVLVCENGAIAESGTFAQLEADSQSRFSRMLSSAGQGRRQNSPKEPASKRSVASTLAKTVDSEARMVLDVTAQLTQDEQKQEGAVSFSTIAFYIRGMGGFAAFAGLLMMSWGWHLSELLPDIFLACWQDDLFGASEQEYLAWWVALSVAGLIVTLVARTIWSFATTRAARVIHEDMLRSIMGCPLAFFDRTPSGRIMNRFGEDQMQVDWNAAIVLEVTCLVCLKAVDIFAFAVVVSPFSVAWTAASLVFFFCIREFHRRTNREAIRWWMLTKSSTFHVFEQMLSGIVTIHAFGKEEHFFGIFEKALTTNLEWLFTRDVSTLWADQRLTTMGSLLVFAISVTILLNPGTVSASVGTTCVIYALLLGENLKWVAYFLVQVEGVFSSAERASEFTNQLEQEPPRRLAHDEELDREGWPTKGSQLVFENVCLRYLEHRPPALDGLSFALRPYEKLGIVGRTGSGKSTIVQALFRLFPLEGGRIVLGEVDLSTVGLSTLRRRLTVVPQEPLLFTGELRRNLDPEGERSESEIWDVLRRCALQEVAKGLTGGLGTHIVAGASFSLGERQVLCLARALLRGACVLCLDEATASMDPESDARIQQLLVEELGHCTVITIAHRLKTVLGSDRILVLDNGTVAQLGHATELLAQDGLFRSLAEAAGVLDVQDNAVQHAPDQTPGPAAVEKRLLQFL